MVAVKNLHFYRGLLKDHLIYSAKLSRTQLIDFVDLLCRGKFYLGRADVKKSQEHYSLILRSHIQM